MKENIKEIELEEAPLFKEFYVVVNYYGGVTPFCSIYNDLDFAKGDKIFKIKVPTNNLK